MFLNIVEVSSSPSFSFHFFSFFFFFSFSLFELVEMGLLILLVWGWMWRFISSPSGLVFNGGHSQQCVDLTKYFVSVFHASIFCSCFRISIDAIQFHIKIFLESTCI